MTDLYAKPQVETIEVRNPADGSVVGSIPVDGPEAVAAKARELKLFQPEWEAMGARGRKPWLLKFQDWFPYSKRKARIAAGVIRAAAARGVRRVGLKPRGDR